MQEPLGPGSQVGDYVIEAEIGRGGMGVVYRAHQKALDRLVALKVIAPNMAQDVTFRGRFDRESRLAAAIEHPNAVPIYEAGQADGTVFIAMRLIDGTDLKALLRKEDWLEAERAADILDQTAGALDAAHALGLVHRDIKPGNILVGKAGGREWAYLTDFGLTKSIIDATEMTESGKWMGTADYASPEQIQGKKELDARSDVYSLGCVFYEMLTGRIPFERDEPVAKLYAHVHDDPPKVSDSLPSPAPSLDAVVERALAKKPSDRFPSAGDLGRAALAASKGDQPTVPERSVAVGEAAPDSEPPKTISQPVSRATRPLKKESGGRPAWVIPVGALMVVAVIVFGAIAVLGGGGDDDGGGGGEPDSLAQNPRPVLDPIDVGARPLSVAVGEGSAWVTNEGDGTVSRINAANGRPQGDPIKVGEEPSNVRVSARSVWVANAGSNSVSRIDPDTGETQEIPVGERPTGVRVGEGSVWVSNTDEGTVSRISLKTNEETQKIDVGSQPAGIAIEPSEKAVFVVNSGDDSLTRINAVTGEVEEKSIPVGAQPRGIVADFGSVWVTNSGDDSVSRVSTSTNRLQKEIPVGDMPAQVMHEADTMWVANQGDGTVTQIEPDDDQVLSVTPVAEELRGIGAGEDLVWVVSSANDQVFRIRP